MLKFPVPVDFKQGNTEVSVVVSQDEQTTPSEAETESTLVDMGNDQEDVDDVEEELEEGEESGEFGSGGGGGSTGGNGRAYVPMPQNLLQSQRYTTQRLSDGGACYNLDANKDIKSSDGPRAGKNPGGEGDMSAYGDIHERIMSHMSWVVLEDDDWHLGDMRPRVSSMPAKSLDTSLSASAQTHMPNMGQLKRSQVPEGHKVRSYAITPKGVVKKGEVFVNRSSSTSVASNDSESNHSNVSADLPVYRVMVSGEVGVGKRALVHSFLASDSDNLDMCSFGEYKILFWFLFSGKILFWFLFRQDFILVPFQVTPFHSDISVPLGWIEVTQERPAQRSVS